MRGKPMKQAMKYMRHWLLACVLTVGLAGCAWLEGWWLAHQYAEALEKRDYAAAYQLLSVDTQRMMPLAMFETGFRMRDALSEATDAGRVRYQVVSVEGGDQKATAVMQVTRPDMEHAARQKLKKVMGSLTGDVATPTTQPDAVPMVQETLRLRLVKEAGGWKIRL